MQYRLGVSREWLGRSAGEDPTETLGAKLLHALGGGGGTERESLHLAIIERQFVGVMPSDEASPIPQLVATHPMWALPPPWDVDHDAVHARVQRNDSDAHTGDPGLEIRLQQRMEASRFSFGIR
jgi:hypothetical protein